MAQETVSDEGTIGDSSQVPVRLNWSSRCRSFGPVSRLLYVVTKENICRKIWIARLRQRMMATLKLLKPWVKPQYRASPRGQWARTPDEAAEQWKGQVTTCAEPGACRKKRAVDREPCWEIVPPTVDEVLDLILSAAKGKTPGEDGITAEVLGAGGRPVAQLLQTLFAGVGLQRALPIVWKGGIMATIEESRWMTTW